MKQARFTEIQIVAILKEAESGMKVKELCRKHGISDATYYNWKSKYGRMEASDLKRMKELEAENITNSGSGLAMPYMATSYQSSYKLQVKSYKKKLVIGN